MIKRIRKKFCLVDPEFAEIGNYPAFGYRWGGPKDAIVAFDLLGRV
jgi:two-component system response regulator ChvI